MSAFVRPTGAVRLSIPGTAPALLWGAQPCSAAVQDAAQCCAHRAVPWGCFHVAPRQGDSGACWELRSCCLPDGGSAPRRCAVPVAAGLREGPGDGIGFLVLPRAGNTATSPCRHRPLGRQANVCVPWACGRAGCAWLLEAASPLCTPCPHPHASPSANPTSWMGLCFVHPGSESPQDSERCAMSARSTAGCQRPVPLQGRPLRSGKR